MHISRIELENLKSHATSTYKFTRGTTAITGENGAGKTTIIEAIAWALFDHLDYKKEDFVRRGEKKGSVKVTFESGLDEREYTVYRDTGAGYYVTDDSLDKRIANKKEEVLRFLWQHMGLEPGTDLKSLFRQAIGVPQGTFTAIFLEGAAERKAAFDRLLKVEEYRQAAEKLRETSRYIDANIGEKREGIARSEGELLRSETVEAEHRAFTEQTKKLTGEIDLIRKDRAALQASVTDLGLKEQTVTSSQKTFDGLKAEREKAELIRRQLEESVDRAAKALATLDSVRPKHDTHLKILAKLKEMERERNERDRLQKELAKIEAAVVNVNADKARFVRELETLQKARLEIEALRPKAAEQETLEKEIAGLRDLIATLTAKRSQIKGIDENLERLRASFKANHTLLVGAESKVKAAGDITVLEQQESELIQSLATFRAALERDEKFQSEIKNGLCPILSQKCLNLKEGETLESYVASQFSELRSRIANTEKEQSVVTDNLRLAREAFQATSMLDGYRQREKELTEEGQRLGQEKAEIEQQVDQFRDTETRLTDASAKLSELDDPRSRIRFLENNIAGEDEIRKSLSEVESNLERLESDRRLMIEQMEPFRELDEKWSALSTERDSTIEAHRSFLANEAEANSLADRQVQLSAAKSAAAALASKAMSAETDLADAKSKYDHALHLSEKAKLLEAEKLYVQTRSTLEAAQSRQEQLAAELARFTEVRRSLQAAFKEKERLEKVAEATSFIRDTLKEAAPRVARNYVHHVSIEAAQMFRELTGNAELTLKWADDYSIELEEGGYDRPFSSLSGGEQMAAALSVRLGLLKQLTDIRIAFFDEPTTNMDAERRENLAMQISRITHFDQLFVISHDETFDNFVDNVVSVGV